jgi:HEAT repeat protein
MLLPWCLLFIACSKDEENKQDIPINRLEQVEDKAQAPLPLNRFDALRAAILEKRASLNQIEEALTESDPMGLCNTLLQLYIMRDHEGVPGLLEDIWKGDENKHPSLNWGLLKQAAARVALAHTLARIGSRNTAVYLSYIRDQVVHPDQLARAQVAVALGFIGDDTDVPLLLDMARSRSDYAAEAAIKALAIRGSEAAKQALLELGKHYADDPKKMTIIRRMLAEGFPKHRGQAVGIPGRAEY